MANSLSRNVSIYINDKLVKNTLPSLRGELKRLENEQKKATIGSEEYIKASAGIAKIRAILAEQSQNVNNLGKSWESASQKAANYSSILIGMRSAFQMIRNFSSTVQQFGEEAARMDDTYADVMKTTGMTHDEVLKLNEAFKQMDTRTPREELNKLASEAGKLGITGVDGVASFTQAADKIKVALGEDLGDDATTVIGKMAEVYSRSTSQLSDREKDIIDSLNRGEMQKKGKRAIKPQ